MDVQGGCKIAAWHQLTLTSRGELIPGDPALSASVERRSVKPIFRTDRAALLSSEGAQCAAT